jgi:putative resolvase
MTSDLRAESLGRWARRCGISYRTAWRWFRDDRLPADVTGEQMPTGTILIHDGRTHKSAEANKEAVIYARINARQEHSAMLEQIAACRSFCLARGWVVKKIVREVAPGVGPQRAKLARLIQQGTPRLIIAAPSVLSRFDFPFYEALWEKMQSELIVVDRSEELSGEGGALEDLTDAINIICHRHYGPKRGSALVQMLNKVIGGTVSV